MIDPIRDLGLAHNQAAPGDHGVRHLEGITLTGSRSSGVALQNLIALLVANFGLTDNSTA